MQYKTVEPIEEYRWQPIPSYHPQRQVPAGINYAEHSLREKIKTSGGYRDSKGKVRLLR